MNTKLWRKLGYTKKKKKKTRKPKNGYSLLSMQKYFN